MIKNLNEAIDSSWAKRIKENNPNAYAILYGWQYKNEPEVEIAPEIYMDKSSLDIRLNQIISDYSVYSQVGSRGNRYAKGSDIQFYILYPERITESKSSSSGKVGYRNSEYYGANETGLDSIIRYEIGELGNSDIIDTVLATFETSIEEKHVLEAALGILENEEYLGDTALDLVVKTLLNVIWKKYPNAKYGLWLCETPDAIERWYDGNKDNTLAYMIENEQPISDLGFNDQGCLFVYDKPIGNYNIQAKALREDLVVGRVAIFGSNDKELEDICKKFKNKVKVVRDACEDINGFLAMYLYEEGYTDVYTIRGMFKVDTFDWVDSKDFSSKELYAIRKTYGDTSKGSLLQYVNSLPQKIKEEFYYIPHTWCELPGEIIIDAAWKMFEPYIKGELSKSHYYHFDQIEDITTYSGYPVKALSDRKIHGKDYLDTHHKLTESQSKQIDSKVYKLDDITRRQVQRNPLYSKYRVEVVELEPIVTQLMKNTSILGRRTDTWGDSFDKFHIKSNKAYWYNDPIRLVKMSDGEYKVLDGNHRLIALYNDGYRQVECLVKDSQTAAKIEEGLTEDLNSMLPYYKNLQNEDRTYILSFLSKDPTWNEKKESGQYSKWILDKLNRKIIDKDVLGHLGDLLSRFEDNKKQLKDKDINKFKTPEDVDNYLNDDNNYIDLSHRQEVRQRQKDRHNADLNNEATLVYEDSDWEVWIPKTYAASCKLGQGTTWCTASTETSDYFDEYNDKGQLYININKHNRGEKYQFHFESESFMDKNDEEISVEDFFVNNENLYRNCYSRLYAFDIDSIKTQLSDLENNGGLYTYNGGDVPNIVKGYIQKVIVSRGITSIEYGMFEGCSSLTSIEIPDSITSIGRGAFEDCRELKNVYIKDIADWCNIDFKCYDSNPLYYAKNLYISGELMTEPVIPNTVTEIKNYAFTGASFTSIVIPNSVISIGKCAFEFCESLTSIEIPSSVTSIGKDAFRSCSNLKTVIFAKNSQLTSIGDFAFYGCSSLKSILFNGTKEQWKSIKKGAYALTGISVKTIKLNSSISIDESINKTKIDDIETPEELMDWMEQNISYELANDEYGAEDDPPTKTAEEVIKSGTGHCAEQSYLEYKVLDELGYFPQLIFVKENNSKKDYGADGSAHMFVIYQDNDEKYTYFEHSQEHNKGIHKFNSMSELLDFVGKNWWRYDANSDILEVRYIDEPITGVDNWEFAKECHKYEVDEVLDISNNVMEEDVPLDVKWDYNKHKIIEEAYHFGNLEYGRKADKRGIMAGRGTGHFGTGFYTIGSVTDDTDYNGRELWELDLTKYNLFKPRSNNAGYTLHDTLKKLNSLFYRYKYNGYTPNLFKLKPYDLRIKLDDFEYEYGNEGIIKFIDSYFPAYREAIDREINMGKWGAAEQVAYDSIEDFEDFVDDLDFVVNQLELIFPKEIGKVENIVWSLIKDNELDDQDNVDSISTLFIKKMGYEGVDVTHLNKEEDGLSGLDNFSYGSVVYDLKPGTYRKIRDKKEKINK